MAEYTDRLGIRLIGGGASGQIPDEIVNVDVINSAWQKLDEAVGADAVTSGSRPAVPFDGQMVWETNTERLLRWNSMTSQWHVVAEKPEGGGLLVGSIYPWPSDTIPDWGLELNGQTIVGGVASHSALAAIYPGWVVGDDLVLPDWREKFARGAGAGESAGDFDGSDDHAHPLSDAGQAKVVIASGTNGRIAYRRVDSGGISWNGTHKSAQTNVTTTTPDGAASGAGLMGSTDSAESIPAHVKVRWVVCAVSTVGEYDPIVQQAIVADIADHENRIDALELVQFETPTLIRGEFQAGSLQSVVRVNGMVTLTAEIINGNGLTIGAAYQDVIQLPEWARPSGEIESAVSTSSATSFGTVIIRPNGTVGVAAASGRIRVAFSVTFPSADLVN